MERSVSLSARLRELFLNGKWIANTNFKEQITTIGWQQAIVRKGNLNSIALLVFHVNYYLDGMINVFKGGELLIRDRYSFDMPEVSNAEEWQNMVNHFLESAATFVQHVEALKDEDLDAPFANEKYGSYLRNIEGMIEHGYYHLGQIVLIRKLFTEPT